MNNRDQTRPSSHEAGASLSLAPDRTPAWADLTRHAERKRSLSIQDCFDCDPTRAERYTLDCEQLIADFSKHLIDDQISQSLLDLAREMQLAAEIKAMFSGATVNPSEGRAALHTALRGQSEDGFDPDLLKAIQGQLNQVHQISDAVRDGTWLGVNGKPIRDVINLGIGGSDLGPKMATTALREFAHPDIKCHFVANVDGAEIESLLKQLDPDTTLVILASKSFTTRETLLNAETVIRWFSAHLNCDNPQASAHFIGITEQPEKAIAYGLDPERVLELWDWVGGRFSLWSPVGLAVVISIGFEAFRDLLNGARAMDNHYRSAPFEHNIPVQMALLGIWYSNFLGAETHAIVPYCERLHHLPGYLQQLEMESNGKSVNRHGEPVDYKTGTIVWGETGTNGQHSFFQLLHQGTHLVPVDFIGFREDRLSNARQHRTLLANMLAQGAALLSGFEDKTGASYRQQPGNRPSTTLLLPRLTPFYLGMLVALYEHKVHAQGIIWGINSFDQWGVQLGKLIADQLLTEGCEALTLDASTTALFRRLFG
ncbi:MAG: glucose-6-phosphate isomerase [Porticoccaceae bacterium]|nr:glucose-6-phosphate isomerase [Porticoccaceae bacterium]